VSYRIVTTERDGQWIARAHDEETGDLFGVECAGPSEPAAVERLERWLDWQREHAAALEALQQAERAYHRTIAGSAFESERRLTLSCRRSRSRRSAARAADDVRDGNLGLLGIRD
jgi:hypothetical protein